MTTTISPQLPSGVTLGQPSASQGSGGSTPVVPTYIVPIGVISALRASLVIATAGVPVYVTGYYNPADGGEGVFYPVLTDTSSADNSGTIIEDALGQRWYRAYEGETLNVLWFGAHMNSSSDSTAAWTACLAAVPSVGGKVYAPGSYTFSSQVAYTFQNATAGLTIEGDGNEASKLTWAAGQGIIINYIGGFNSVTVRGFSFLCGTTGSASQTALELNMTVVNANAANSAMNLVENCTFRGSDTYQGTNYWANGVLANGVSNVNFVSDNFIATQTQLGIGINTQGTSSTPAVVYDVDNCAFVGLNNSILYGGWVQGLAVENSNFTDCNYGITAGNGELVLDQISVVNCQFACLHAGVGPFSALSCITITGNLFIVGSSAYGVYIQSANAYQIVGNCFVPNTSHTSSTGVAIVANTIPGVITGNTFASITLGVQYGTSTTGNKLFGNVYNSVGTNFADAGSGNIQATPGD